MDMENVVSIDELLDYFFEFGLKPEFDDNNLRSGMATDEQVVESFRGFLIGWGEGGNVNPSLEEVVPELLDRYHKRMGASQ